MHIYLPISVDRPLPEILINSHIFTCRSQIGRFHVAGYCWGLIRFRPDSANTFVHASNLVKVRVTSGTFNVNNFEICPYRWTFLRTARTSFVFWLSRLSNRCYRSRYEMDMLQSVDRSLDFPMDSLTISDAIIWMKRSCNLVSWVAQAVVGTACLNVVYGSPLQVRSIWKYRDIETVSQLTAPTGPK